MRVDYSDSEFVDHLLKLAEAPEVQAVVEAIERGEGVADYPNPLDPDGPSLSYLYRCSKDPDSVWYR